MNNRHLLDAVISGIALVVFVVGTIAVLYGAGFAGWNEIKLNQMEIKMSDDLIKLLTQAVKNMIAEELKQQLSNVHTDDTVLTSEQRDEVDTIIRDVINNELQVEVCQV